MTTIRNIKSAPAGGQPGSRPIFSYKNSVSAQVKAITDALHSPELDQTDAEITAEIAAAIASLPPDNVRTDAEITSLAQAVVNSVRTPENIQTDAEITAEIAAAISSLPQDAVRTDSEINALIHAIVDTMHTPENTQTDAEITAEISASIATWANSKAGSQADINNGGTAPKLWTGQQLKGLLPDLNKLGSVRQTAVQFAYHYPPQKFIWLRVPKGVNTADEAESRMFQVLLDVHSYPAHHSKYSLTGYYYVSGTSYKHILNQTSQGYVSYYDQLLTDKHLVIKSWKDEPYIYIKIPMEQFVGYPMVNIRDFKMMYNYRRMNFDLTTIYDVPFEDIDDTKYAYETGSRAAKWDITADAGLLIANYDDPTKLLNYRRSNDTYFTPGASGYLTLDFKAVKVPQVLRIVGNIDIALSADCALEYSDDNASWTVHPGYTSFAINTNTDIVLTNDESHQYWRIKFNNPNANPWLYDINFAFKK